MQKRLLVILLLFSIFLVSCASPKVQEEIVEEVIEELPAEKITEQEIPQLSDKRKQIEEIKEIMENMPEHMKEKMPEETKKHMTETIENMEWMEEMDMGDMIDEGDMEEMMQMMKQRMAGGEKLDLSQGIPKFVKHDFIELDRIDKISKLRSGYGHDFSYGTDEKCRSMKHYFWAKGGDPGKPHSPKWMTIKYFSPVDGTIRDVTYTEHEYGTEAQFVLHPDEQSAFRLRFFHIKIPSALGEGSKVKAGQEIGTIGHEDSHGEIGVEVQTIQGMELISFLQIVDDNVFAEYQKRGIEKREDLIISREERDANPLECDYSTEAGFFAKRDEPKYQKWSTGKENWVFLN